jgi:hypothetical protein
MERMSSFLDLLPHFSPAFTAPTYQYFVSQRHRFITEVIFPTATSASDTGFTCQRFQEKER